MSRQPVLIADSLGAEVARLRELGKLPPVGAQQPAPAAQPLRVTDGMGDPDCTLCHGLGYLRNDIPANFRDERVARDFGKLQPCDCAAARLQSAKTAQLRRETRMDEIDLQLSWGQLINTPELAEAIQSVRHAVTRGWGWVYLHGNSGPGKSTVVKTAVAESVRAGAGAVFVTWPDLLNHMRQGFKDGDYDARVEAWRSVPVLAIDEYGRAKESEWVAEAQVLVLNHRHESALHEKSVTLFTSNFAPDSERVDDWLYDRLRDKRHRIVNVTGPSLRPLME